MTLKYLNRSGGNFNERLTIYAHFTGALIIGLKLLRWQMMFFKNNKPRLSESIFFHLAEPTVFFKILVHLYINILVLYHN